MTTHKIAITIDEKVIRRLDKLVAEQRFPNRSRAIQEAIEDKLERIEHSRLAREAAKLDRRFERMLADEGLVGGWSVASKSSILTRYGIGFIVLLTAMLLLSCANPTGASPTLDNIRSPAVGTSPTPSTLDSGVVPIQPSTTSIEPMSTDTPVSSPTPPECNAGFVVFVGYDNILYRACADGSSVQRFMTLMPWAIDSLRLYDMVLSPDGHRLAIPEGGGRVIDITQNTEVASFKPITDRLSHYISWSPDGQYIGLASAEGNMGRVYIIHLESQTVSELPVALDVVLPQVEESLAFDWSPDGKMLTYVFSVSGRQPTVNSYVANIDCASVEHTCEITNEQKLPWIDSWSTLTWTPDSLSLIAGFNTSVPPADSVIETRTISGEIIQRINLDMPEDFEIIRESKTVLSPDGNHIAFFAADGGIGLFVLDVKTMDIIEIAHDVNPTMIHWLPE